MEERARRQKLLRVALLLQAVGLLVTIGLTVPDYVDGQLHPLVCTGMCIDLRGLPFELTMVVFGPVIALLVLLAWRWRGPRLWPLVVVGVADAAAIALVASVVIDFAHTRFDSVPSVASAPPLLLLPALATLALGTNLVWPVPWKPIVAVSAAGSLVLAAFLWSYVIGPVHQRIPGEISLPFSKSVAYEARDLGCVNYEAGWTFQHQCLSATLVVYRGSGDAATDQAIINHVLLAQKRIQPGEEHVGQLPVSMSVNSTYALDVDGSNAGLCLIIADRVTPAPSKLVLAQCGTSADYADIRSHWPADDAYAIGVIYYYYRPDYRH